MDGKSLDITTEKMNQLRAIFPEVFSEGKVDFERLKAVLGEDTFVQGEHYELSWAGKTEARKEVQKQTTATLVPDKENSLNFGTTQNLFIEGDNLEVLRILQKSYFGKVKMIYIDPPYNTGNDSFVYPDDYAERKEEYLKRTDAKDKEGFFKKLDLWKKNSRESGHFHSVWLSMMYPRLYLARNLMREDGVIFISIDDNEASNLKLLCDEIFGESNFVANVIWEKKFAPANDAKWFSDNHDHILVYSRSKEIWRPILLDRSEENLSRYKNLDNDPRGVWVSGDMTVKTYNAQYDYEIITPSGRKVNPPTGICWRFSKEKFDELLLDNRIWFGENGDNVPRLKRFLSDVKEGVTPLTIWHYKDVGHNQEATQECRKLFNDKLYFETPKPVRLLKRVVKLGSNQNDIILDFFAGSATTAQAVLELNEEDGGNRSFICVQFPEPTDEKSEAHKAGYKTIADISKARIQKAIGKIEKEREGKLELENRQTLGFSAYSVAPSNFKIWQGIPEAIEQQLLDLRTAEEASSRPENMLVELMLKGGLGLGAAYQYEGGFYKTAQGVWFCFEPYTNQMKDAIVAAQPPKVVFLNSCFSSDEALTNLRLELKENEVGMVVI